MKEIRNEIDKIDKQIKLLLEERLLCSKKVAEIKADSNSIIFDKKRENEILSGIDNSYIKALYKDIMRQSRSIQYLNRASGVKETEINTELPKTVCVQGVKGSYSSIAASKLFDGEIVFKQSFEDVFLAVSKEECEVGVLPLDNTTTGTINEVYDLLLQYGLYITGEINLSVCHCLVGKGELSEIKTVISHGQALMQCQQFIKNNKLKQIECENTAVAAGMVCESNDKSIAAIASKEAAKNFGLNIISENINDHKENFTRFIAITRNLTAPKEGGKISIVVKIEHEAGALLNTIACFANYDISLTKIQSRPIPDKPWEYFFYIDFEGNLNDINTKGLLNQLESELGFVKILGNYT